MIEKSKNPTDKSRKEQVKNWLKKRENFAFCIILFFAFAVRLYYFFLTKNQALWWDEADYLAYAKNLAGFGVDWIVTAKHNSIVSYIAAIIFKFGLDVASAKFIMQFIPSILTVILVYFLCNEMYKDKRVGLIAAFITAVLWDYSFNATRFHVDIPALFTGLLAIYIFWKGYEKKEKIFGKISQRWAMPLTAFFVVLAYMIRRGHFLFGIFILVYVLIMYNWKGLIKDKYNWIALGVGLVMIFLAEKIIFNAGIEGVAGGYFHEELKINFLPFDIFPAFFSLGTFLSSTLFYLFLIGTIVVIGKLFLTFGHWKKEGSSRADIFNVIMIAITLSFFIFVLRTQEIFGEVRWYYPLLFASLVFIGKGSISLFELIRPYSKNASLIIIILLIAFGGYYQLKTGDQVIRDKLHSFEGIRDASILIKESSIEGDKVLTLGQPQVEFYSERATVHAREWVNVSPDKIEHFGATLKALEERPDIKYLLISFSEPGYPDWMKKVNYNDRGQIISWEIPFALSKIDFITGEQKVLSEADYGNIKFKLLGVKKEVFVYEIIRL